MTDMDTAVVVRDFLFPGVVLEMEVLTAPEVCRFDAVAAEVEDSGLTVVLPPSVNTVFRPNDSARIIAITEQGLCSFTTRVLRFSAGTAPVAIFALPDRFQRNQRREDARVAAHVRVRFEAPAYFPAIDARMRDVSAGGC